MDLRVDRTSVPRRRFGRHDDRRSLLRAALNALRGGDVVRARLFLESPLLGEADPARLNLLGVLSELAGYRGRARRFYTRAVRADRDFQPAWQNLRRLYELRTPTGTRLPVAVDLAGP